MYRSSPFHSTLNTSYITGLDMWSMYRSSPFRSTLNTSYITGFDISKVCTEAVHSVALWTRVTPQVWSCVQFTHPSSPFRSTLNASYITGWTCVKYVPKQSIALWTRVTSQFGHVWSLYRRSPFCSTLNTSYIKGWDMCAVCTEAVHSV